MSVSFQDAEVLLTYEIFFLKNKSQTFLTLACCEIFTTVQTILHTHIHYTYILYICIYFTHIRICILYIYISILTCLSISHFIEVK